MKVKELKQAWVDKISHLDFDLILMNVLNLEDRSQIITIDEEEIKEEQFKKIVQLLDRKAEGEPTAYILGYKDFFGRRFLINNKVLIPRAETESLVEKAIGITRERNLKKILDVGCGSGAIAISLALELDEEVAAVDVNQEAINVAQKNCLRLGAKVSFLVSDLLEEISDKQDLIIANLPYVDKNWNWLDLKALSFEPRLALYANDNGIGLIKKLLIQATDKLEDNGFIILELDPIQQDLVEAEALRLGFKRYDNKKNGYMAIFTK